MATLTFWCKIVSLYFTALSFSFAEFTLTVLHTNDLHCRFEETDKFGSMCRAVDRKRQECYGGVSRRATKVDEIRSKDSNVILLDAGDQLTGTLWYQVYKGNASVAFMNELKYDVVTLGNHDFDGGVDHTISYIRQLKVPIVLSNVNVTREKKWPNPNNLFNTSIALDVGSEKIGLCGYILPRTSILSKPGSNIIFYNEIESVRRCAQELKTRKINKIIALGHSGIDVDKMIAQNVEEIDIVVGGHSNTFLYTGPPPSNDRPYGSYPLVLKKTGSSKQALVVQAYAYGKYLGYLKTVFDDDGNLARWSGNPILLDKDVIKKPSIMRKLTDMKKEVDKVGKVKIGQTNVFLDGERYSCYLSECALGNLITNAVIFDSSVKNSNPNHWTNASIALWTGNSIMASIDVNKTGYILYQDVLNSFPYGNMADMIEILGSDLVIALEQSVSKYDASEPRGDFLQMSGIKVTYDLSKPSFKRISSIEVRCAACHIPKYAPLIRNQVYKPFDRMDDKASKRLTAETFNIRNTIGILLKLTGEHQVIISSYMAKGGAGYNVFKTKRLRYYPGNEVDIDIVLRYIKARTPLTIGLDGRVRINKSTMKNVAFSFERKVHLILSSFLTYVTWNFYL